MDWVQVLTIAGSTVSACWLMHRENLKDRAEAAKDRAERASEIKDFHGRLCTLEERYLQMMQRVLEERK